MRNSLSFYIGWRYVRAKRRNGFISFVSWFALVGMAIGVFSLIIVLSVMNGFDHELKQRILRVVPHGFISSDAPLVDWQSLSKQVSDSDHLIASAPFIDGTGLLAFGGRVKPIQIQGIDPEREKAISLIDDYMLIGSTMELNNTKYGIILGRLLAGNLGLNIGDTISVTLPQVSITPAGVFARSKRFKLIGVFEVGAQVDQTLAVVSLNDAQKLFKFNNSVQGLRVKFDDIYKAPSALANIVNNLGEGYSGKNWSQTQGSLFQAVKMEKTVVGIMLGIIIAVAAFNIISSLTMMVMEKRSNIAVLRTLGMTRGGITLIFLVQGVSMGLVGIIVGGLLGTLVALNVSAILSSIEQLSGWQLFDPLVYFVSFLPSKWSLSDTLLICSFAFFSSFIASIYPAWKASKIEPAEALKYDS